MKLFGKTLKKTKKIIDNLTKKNDAPWYKIYEDEDIPKSIDYPDISLYERIVETKDKYPYNLAYEYFGTTVTYKKFIKEIDDCSKALKNLGVREGHVVTICMPNVPEALIAFYAINKIGAIANMIHPLSSENEIKYYLNISSTMVVIAVDLVWPKISKIINETEVKKTILVSVKDSMNMFTSIGYWLTQGRKNKKVKLDASMILWKDFIYKGRNYIGDTLYKGKNTDPAVILYSGGTTGKPKGIIHTSLSFNSVAEQEIAICKDLKAGRTILSVMPIFHGFGLGSTIHAPLCVGSTCILLPSFQAKKFGNLLKKYRPNVIAGVPTIYEGLINSSALKDYDLSFLKCSISGGDTLSVSLKQKVDEFFKEHNADTKIRTAFGMTECASGVTMMPRENGIDSGIGIPCPDSFIKICKPNTRDELPYGEEGEICISGPSVMVGYLNEPKETAQTLQVHDDKRVWLHTGDLGSMDEKGYVYFEQRLKRMIVSSGYNIYPGQIEEIIERHPDVLTCTVIGVDHPYKVQVAKAFIVLKEGISVSPKIKKEIKELCEENMAAYAIPHDFEYRKSLPTTLIGKVAFKELEKQEKEKSESKNEK